MSRLFAFRVASPVTDPPQAPVATGYDAATQTLVWEGDSGTTMGTALCSGGYYSGRNPCRSTGTACTGTRCDKSYLGCYACDYA